MKSLSIVSIALMALVGSAVGIYTAESETFTGTAATTITYKRSLLLVGGKRYVLKASDKRTLSHLGRPKEVAESIERAVSVVVGHDREHVGRAAVTRPECRCVLFHLPRLDRIGQPRPETNWILSLAPRYVTAPLGTLAAAHDKR